MENTRLVTEWSQKSQSVIVKDSSAADTSYNLTDAMFVLLRAGN
jgi:hypothetical protein